MSLHSIHRLLLKIIIGLAITTIPVLADVPATYQYTENNGSITITGVDSPLPTGDLTIPDTISGKTVTSIGSYAFYYCTGLTKVTIPSTVTIVGDGAFNGCFGLETISIPPAVSIIGYSAFNGCSSLVNLTISAGVTTIGSYAFNGCTSLTSVTIPSTVTSIGTYAFNSCSSLTTAIISGNITSIQDGTFSSCFSLTSLPLPASVTSIGNNAFSHCSSLTDDLIIPDNVTSIGDNAFQYCSGLPSVTIPATVASIGTAAFQNCISLGSFDVLAGNASFSSVDGVLFNQPQTTLIEFPANGTTQDYTIPSSVTSIAKFAFDSCISLTSVTIPDNVTSIGDYAFNACTGLSILTIPVNVASIGNNAFSGCTNLVSLSVDASNQFFSNSVEGVLFNKLKTTLIQYPAAKTAQSYSIPATVTNLGASAFQRCGNLTSVNISSGVTSIGDNAFQFCSGLTSVSIPASVTTIGNNAFYGCGGLAAVTLNTGLTSIGMAAFEFCGSLTTVTIPSSVTNISDYAFFYCNFLTSATFLGDAPTSVGYSIFDYAANGFTVYYSSASTGFTSPKWMGYTAVASGGGSPLATWQTDNHLVFPVDMLSTPNHDGVSLLMDYALDLDPNMNQSGNLPKLIVSGSTLQISFPCDTSRTDVTYTVQASSTLASGDWTDIASSVGGAVVQSSNPLITITDSGTGARTATVSVSTAALPQGHGFLRLKVSAP